MNASLDRKGRGLKGAVDTHYAQIQAKAKKGANRGAYRDQPYVLLSRYGCRLTLSLQQLCRGFFAVR
jgi:hypothetical protein